jgi:hypothetical protein
MSNRCILSIDHRDHTRNPSSRSAYAVGQSKGVALRLDPALDQMVYASRLICMNSLFPVTRL